MTSVRTPVGTVNVVDNAGEGPAVVMMHGFPDDSHIYDQLSPLLSDHRIITFDFVGYGGSDRIEQTATVNRQSELASVLDALNLDGVVLVAHDASGPVAIDCALDTPARISHLILLNTYYGHAPSLHLPEMIRLLADPDFKPLADAMIADQGQRLWLLQHTARQFGSGDELAPDGIEAVSILPQFFGDNTHPDALGAVRGWTATLFEELARQDERITASELARLEIPVTLAFGENDDYLGTALAQHLGELFRNASVNTISKAGHWPQWDQPEEIAAIIRASTAA